MTPARHRGTALRALLGLSLLCAAAVVHPHSALAAPFWLRPIDLSAAGQSAEYPQVAVDPAGDAVAVWARSNGANTIVQSAARPAGGAWGAPLDLSAAGQNARNPQVSVDAVGDAVAVWARYDGSNTIVEVASASPGGAWQPAQALSAAGQSAESPQVAVDPAGDAVAVWARSNGTNTIVQSAARPAGGAWGAPHDLSAAGQNAESPQVAVDQAGDAVAVWARYDGSNTIVEVASASPGGAWQPAQALSAAGQSAESPQVAVDPAGDAVAVWARSNGTNTIVQSAARPAGGAWGAPLDLSAAGQNARNPRRSRSMPAGDAVAVWARYDGSNTIVEVASASPGGAWQPAQALSAAGQSAESPQVAVDPAGDAVAVWARSNGTNTIVQSAARPAGGAWGAPLDLSAAGGNASTPQAAIDPEGNAVATWDRFNGSASIVEASGYDAAGPRLDSVGIPSAGTVHQPLAFSVAAFDVWSPLASIAWSFGDGSSAADSSPSHAYASPGAYPVSVTAADDVGNSTSAVGIVRIYPKARAGRYARLRHGRALLRVFCPSTASCHGKAKLIIGVTVRRGHRIAGKRLQVGKARFVIPPKRTTTVPVPISRKGRRAVRAAGRKGVKAQLTGPGIKHRSVLLLPA